MGCNCGKTKQAVKYEVKFGNGATPQKYDSPSQAAAEAAKVPGSSYKPVPA